MKQYKLPTTLVDRFLNYAKIDTQSDPNSTTFPSTEKQKNLGKLLVQELRELGIQDAHLDEHGYVYATVPANTDKTVPVICFCSHMDTSPDSSGTNVKPIIHNNYQGDPLQLPDDPKQIISQENHPHLKEKIGHDIITASGTTLLGADNKSGLAAIMTAVQYMVENPDFKHGKIRILFTPDEEIGKGVDKVDIEKLGADFGYTIDGEQLGTLEDETFSADAATITVSGVSVHPGFAKGKLESALKIASDIVAKLPKDGLSPETTEGKEGFIHPVSMEGTVEQAKIELILRDFDNDKLENHAALLQQIVDGVIKHYPNSSVKIDIKEQYRNMKNVLDNHPQIADFAEEAIQRSGIDPIRRSIRGGTDGSRLSFMGLPCPNIFAGEYSFHSKQEWTSVQDMQKSVETILNLSALWEEKGGK